MKIPSQEGDGGYLFESAQAVLPDAIMKATADFRADTRQHKLNLGIGICSNERGESQVPDFVRTALAKTLSAGESPLYLPALGYEPLLAHAREFLFGPEAEKFSIGSIQANGGTGALSLVATYLKNGNPGGKNPYAKCKVLVSQPTWTNHNLIFKLAGHSVSGYPYLSADGKSITVDGLHAAVEGAEKPTVIVAHVSCHNCSAYDPTQAQWDSFLEAALAAQVSGKPLMLVFDSAYQSLGRGRDEDAYAVRKACQLGLTFFVAESYSKKLALYRHRLGILHYHSPNPDNVKAVVSSLANVVCRGTVSSTSITGAVAAYEILKTAQGWEEAESFHAAKRKSWAATRNFIVEHAKGDFSYLQNGNGMFILRPGVGESGQQYMWREHGIQTVVNPYLDPKGIVRPAVRICIDPLDSDDRRADFMKAFNSCPLEPSAGDLPYVVKGNDRGEVSVSESSLMG